MRGGQALKVLRSYSVYERGGEAPHPHSHREKAHLEPTSTPCRAASPPCHEDVPGAVTSPWDYFTSSFLSGFEFLGGKIGSCFLSVELCSQGHGPLPTGRGKRKIVARLFLQTSRTLPWGGSFMLPVRLSEPYANRGIREVMASPLHHRGVPFYFWLLRSPPTPNGPQTLTSSPFSHFLIHPPLRSQESS